MKISVDQVYTSAACNRTPEIADWNNEGLICFGACNAVVIYDTHIKNKDPLTVLSHHKSQVNSVKWVQKSDNTCIELLSCSADKTAAIWTLENGSWKVSSSLVEHKDGVSCIHGVYVDGNNLLVYTGSIDSTVCVWERIDGTTTLKQKINLYSGLALTLHSCLLPSINRPVLFCALDDHKVHIFVEQDDRQYHRVHMLAGHEDWVRGLDVLTIDSNTLMLASASQDTYIRLWKIQRYEDAPVSGIKVEERLFEAYTVKWSVKLDAVLAGHEGWVYGVQWQTTLDNETTQPTHRLLSSSLDKTLIIWQPESDGGAWTEHVRVGEVGGNGLGYYGSRFGPDAFLGHGYNGSLHIWRYDKESSQWQPSVVVGGHFGAVEDIRWESQGRYLVSVSLDQTTRLHAPWRRADGSGTQWHEIARPQVHGYDMASIALVSPTAFASAAEEKVLRVFRAPHNFTRNFRNIAGGTLAAEDVDGPEGASVPSLGLSNKAVFSARDAGEADDNDGYFVPVELHEPPTEETLVQNTLWPEARKLYGHGYEVYCVDASPDGGLVASACRATTAEHAAVLLWETKTWNQIQKLISHQLTVTQLAFSPDSQRLLSVSRDRRWTLYHRAEGSNSFDIDASTDKKNGVHTRIIWCCAWAHDNSVFSTGSRDGKVCVWSKTDTTSDSSLRDYSLLGKPLELADSVTALAFAPVEADARIVAVGLDTGGIRLYGFELTWSLLRELDNKEIFCRERMYICSQDNRKIFLRAGVMLGDPSWANCCSLAHHLTVKRLFFKPRQLDGETNSETLLASCGSDHFVRINKINVL